MDFVTVRAIKSADGEWELDVLGIPFGDESNRDSDGEFFTPRTKLHEDKFPHAPAVYYHGYDDSQKPAASPQYIGRTVSAERRDDGVWYRVVLNKANDLAKRVWDAAQRGAAFASSGSVAHLVRKARNGEILEWPVAELSIFDTDNGKRPANRYAVALPVLKAVYDEAGIRWPTGLKAELFDTENHSNTGVMVALYPDEKTAQMIAALPGVETPANELHVTLAYYGNAADLKSTHIASIIKLMGEITERHHVVTGRIGGIGRFSASESSDDMDVLYANVDCPGIEPLRVKLLENWGARPIRNHGYTPHMTLAYIPTTAEMPITKWEPIPVTFDSVSVVVGDKRESFKLSSIQGMTDGTKSSVSIAGNAKASKDGATGGASAAAQNETSDDKADTATDNIAVKSEQENNIMSESVDIQAAIAEQVAAALREAEEKAEARRAEEAKAAELAALKSQLENAQKERDEAVKQAAESRRLDSGSGAPYVSQFADTAKYDGLEVADMAVLYAVTDAARKSNKGSGPTDTLRKALAIRLADSEETAGAEFVESRKAMKMAGMPLKANELNQSTLANYGDEWVGVTYSSQLWDKIRLATPVVGKIPTVVVPQGSESIVIPTASASPTFYKVAQASAQASNTLGDVTNTINTSKLGTANQTLTVAKLGAAAIYTGELEEDSLINWAAELRRDLTNEAAEVLEHIVIDGDTETGATTNINDIAGTPAGTEAFLLFNGFRKLALVTNTANSRDGGALAIEDFLETVKLMGTGGKNAYDRNAVSMIVDMHTYWKALQLTEMKSRDYVPATTVAGQTMLTPWGYEVIGSPNMHRASTDATYGLKANSAGKIDLDTAGNNTKGAIVAVRWDQWRFGYKRQMSFEIERFPRADATSIVVTMRVGMINRDTDASAISYNITV